MATIRTYLRIKPSNKSYEDFDLTGNCLYLRLPEGPRDSGGSISLRGKPTINHEFKFTGTLNQKVAQEEVFDTVARQVIDGFLTGYNGTIFAYGQTGSGKTFTCEGSARRYDDRGLAPRAISMIYQSLESRQNEDIQIHLSYMEIYQEVGYDLLNSAARNNTAFVTPLPKVAVVEGPKGSCIIRNLSNHLAANEDVAQNLLLQGQANRKVAETPMNQRSSRSHAVLTIHLTTKKHDSDTVVKSKLHLVDLAGSERVAKTGIAGLQLAEAKFINLSLHYLEGVIIALQQDASGDRGSARPRPQTPNFALYNRSKPKGDMTKDEFTRWVNSLRPQSADGFAKARPSSAGYATQTAKHIPYRNSLLTMILRDSLGGNCQTAMVATISVEEDNLNESVSTCRFAQRVACITNKLEKNEQVDDRSMIRRLRKRIAELETELSLLRSGQDLDSNSLEVLDSKLTDEDKLNCAKIMQAYLGGRIKDPITAGVTNPLKFRECLRILKMMILEHYTRAGGLGSPQALPSAGVPTTSTRAIQQSENNRQPHSRDRSPSSAKSDPSRQPTTIRIASGKVEQISSNNHTKNPPWKDNKEKENQSSEARQDILGEHEGVPVRGRRAWGEDDEDSMRPNIGSRASSAVGSRVGSSSGSRSRPKPQPQRTGSASSTRSAAETEKARKEYKTPFERKRDSEIKKLDKKVTKAKETVNEERQHLREFQADLKIQQLDLIKKELKNKMLETKEQVKEQHSYLKQLKHSKADPEIYQQEKLVEKQLRKRQIKMERRMGLVDEQLAIIIKHKDDLEEAEKRDDNVSQEKGSNSFLCSIEQKYPQYVRRDGKVNAKQVLGVLQVQEKETEKMQARVESERIMTLSKQIEIKESATRQKLLEFKEKLRQAKRGKASHSPQRSEEVLKDYHSSEQDEQASEKSAGSNDKPMQKQTIPTKEIVFGAVGGQPKVDTQNPNQSSNAFLVKLQSRSRGSRPATAQSSTELMEQWSQNLQQKKKADDKWDENYSRRNPGQNERSGSSAGMTRPHSAISAMPVADPGYDATPRVGAPAHVDDSDHHLTDSMESSQSGSRLQSDSAESFMGGGGRRGRSRTKPSDRGGERRERGGRGRFRSESNESSSADRSAYTSDAAWSRDSSREKLASRDPSREKYFSRDSSLEKFGSRDSSKEGRRKSRDHSLEKSGELRSSSLDSMGVTGQAIHLTSTNGNLSDAEKTRMRTRSASEQPEDNHFDTMLPSEYINQGNADHSFDGRKMGLSKQNFDEALSKMLGTANVDPETPLTIEHEQYNEFARAPRHGRPHPAKPRDRSQSAKVTTHGGSSSKSPYSVPQHAQLESQIRPKSSVYGAWGPEAKNMSISERLAKYLDMDSYDKNSKLSKSYEDSDAHPTRKKKIAIEDETTEGPMGEWKKRIAKTQVKSDLDLDNFAPKIRALEDEEREEKYMSSAREQKDRVKRIRKARHAAEVIQSAWRNHLKKKGHYLESVR